ncbi:MAG: hypothetical protein HC902_07000 [Calothrix sp. SM1_5_4]|nr:hypothetical protein [Calothrix sp. SM1_5_4]
MQGSYQKKTDRFVIGQILLAVMLIAGGLSGVIHLRSAKAAKLAAAAISVEMTGEQVTSLSEDYGAE